jgi:hypothetical protein
VTNTAAKKSYIETENELERRKGLWKKPKRVLGIQASACERRSVTEMVYRNFIAGMKQAGSETETVYLAEKDFKDCLGCFTCWKREDGECVQQDDLTPIIQRLPEYDLMILATPFYLGGSSALLRGFLDRLTSLLHADTVLKDGGMVHPAIHPRLPFMALVAVSGFYEEQRFSPLVEHLKGSAAFLHMPLVATVLRPCGQALCIEDTSDLSDRVLQAVRTAGAELAEKGKIPSKLHHEIVQPLVTQGKYHAVNATLQRL